jgi:hypothetical protein
MDKPKLTIRQQEVLNLILKDKLTVPEISSRLEITRAMVYKYRKKLIKKGYLNDKFRGGLQNGMVDTIRGVTKYWRLHDLHFVIEPFYFYERYEEIRLKKGNFGIPYDRWKIFLNTRNIELMLQDKKDIRGFNPYEVSAKAEKEFNNILERVSKEYGFEAYKNRKANIRLVNQHWAEVENEIAKEHKGQYLQIRGEDNKVWFVVDLSMKPQIEGEYVHSQRAKEDALTISKHLNILRKPETLNNEELQDFLSQNVKQTTFLTNYLTQLMQEINSHTSFIQASAKVLNISLERVMTPLALLKSKIKSKEDINRLREDIAQLSQDERFELSQYLVKEGLI